MHYKVFKAEWYWHSAKKLTYETTEKAPDASICGTLIVARGGRTDQQRKEGLLSKQSWAEWLTILGKWN